MSLLTVTLLLIITYSNIIAANNIIANKNKQKQYLESQFFRD